MTVKCPICRKEVTREKNPEFPFCSDRCRTIDLGNWASEKYAISTPAKPGFREMEEESDD